MAPDELDLILDTLRKHGVVSAEVPYAGTGGATGALRVVFAPEVGPNPPGDEVTPGGWKSPAKLDRDPLDDERNIP